MDVDFPFEIVVTDNCSTDDTQEVARKYQNLENFRYFRQTILDFGENIRILYLFFTKVKFLF